MSRKYKFHYKSGLYFVSFATVYWIDVFTREIYFAILANSIDYCRKEKGMELYAYCFMPSHVHFIFRSSNDKPMALLRDFKKYTSKETINAIRDNPTESRKEWLLSMFEKAGKLKGNIKNYQFWQHHNKPIEYIHNNPVESGFVTNAIEWKYSSARNFQEDHTVLEIDAIGFIG